MRNAALQGFATATDLADYLVRKGTPFRDAHEVVGKAVAYCVDKGCDLADLDLKELQRFSSQIDGDVFDVLTLEGSVSARDHLGGTAPRQVAAAAHTGPSFRDVAGGIGYGKADQAGAQPHAVGGQQYILGGQQGILHRTAAAGFGGDDDNRSGAVKKAVAPGNLPFL